MRVSLRIVTEGVDWIAARTNEFEWESNRSSRFTFRELPSFVCRHTSAGRSPSKQRAVIFMATHGKAYGGNWPTSPVFRRYRVSALRGSVACRMLPE